MMTKKQNIQCASNSLARYTPGVEIMPVHRAIEIGDGSTMSDAQVISLWLHGLSKHTQRAYIIDSRMFFSYIRQPLQQITLQDLQDYADELDRRGFKPRSKHRRLCAIKSLLTFAYTAGYLRYNVGRLLKLPIINVELAQRILTEVEVQTIIALETNYRNKILIKLLYCGGVRNFEAAGLIWRDMQEREKGGQMTVHGKREKTHIVLLPEKMWQELMQLRQSAVDTDPVFKSRTGGHLGVSQVFRIVQAAARRAGIKKNVSPHWLRHSHASHALDRGAPIHLVQQTLAHASITTTSMYLHARPSDSSSMYLAI